MILTYLGTAAAEGFPAVFCNCAYCREARALAGKNIRTRSQSLIGDNLLIDLPADTYSHFLQNGIEGDKIKYLLITHMHSDHFYKDELNMRSGAFAHDMRAPTLQMFCSEKTFNCLDSTPRNVEVTILKEYETVEIGDYRVTTIPARHISGGGSFIYVIEGDKTLLYAHDTGYFYNEVFDFIAKKGFVFDMISLDCTNVDIPITDEGGHMGLPNIERVISRLTDLGAVNTATVKYVNHFSHNANPLQDLLEKKAALYGCHVAYDGCRVEF